MRDRLVVGESVNLFYLVANMHSIQGKAKDLGDGFQVLRILPHLDARSVGPFIFVDHFGPVPLVTGNELTVRPHPHIGLATITYLYDGLVLHKDSLQNEVLIRPGAVNWMTAGRGIVHSEHSRLDATEKKLEGIQTWVALPLEHEETAPAFDHYDASVLPEITGTGYAIRVIAGSFMGKTSPVRILSPLFYADLEMEASAHTDLEFTPGWEAAIYVARGNVVADGVTYGVGSMLVIHPEEKIALTTKSGARAVLLGGEKLAEPRHLWWNFVSSSRERLEKAKADWRSNAMGIVPGETDRIPLPE